MPYLRRREFIATLGGAAAWPLAAGAQLPGQLPTIGLLTASSATTAKPWIAAFLHRLRELGRIEGRSVAIEYRWAEGQIDRAAELVAELVQLNVDVIVTSGTGPVAAAKQATSIIPIVFTAVADPIGAGLVAGLARPAGNITGLSLQQPELVGKRIELLREVVPGLRRLGVLANGVNASLEMREAQAAAETVGLQVVTSEFRRAEEIPLAFEAMRDRADALYVCGDSLANTQRLRISTLALGLRLPTIFPNKEYAEAAGLMSYGPNFVDLWRRSADIVDRILKGAKPGDIPVEQPTKFDLVINLTTAKALGLAMPEQLLVLANQLID